MKLSNRFRWILYDWANSVFATSVVAALFPVMLKKYWASHLNAEDSTYYLGLTNSLTSLAIFLLALFTGYLVDTKLKKPQFVLFILAFLGSVFSFSLFFVGAEDYTSALFIYAFSFIFFALGNTVYDSLLLRISKSDQPENIEKTSSYGYFAGYLGGGVLLLIQAICIIFYKSFGFHSVTEVAKLSFISVGIWWIMFSLPLLGIKTAPPVLKKVSFIKSIVQFYKSLSIKARWFLFAFFLYIDVVFTTYKMAIDFGLSIGLSQEHLIGILIYVQFIGAPGTLFIQYISNKKNIFFALIFGLCCYGLVLGLSPFVKSVEAFLILATLIGLSQGGIQSLSRAYFVSVTPKDSQGLSFGFLNLIGKASAITGPLVVGLSAKAFGSTYSVIALLPFLFLGGAFLLKSLKTPENL